MMFNLIDKVVTLPYGSRSVHNSELKGIANSDLICVCREGRPFDINNVSIIAYPTPGIMQVNFMRNWGLLIFDQPGLVPEGEKVYYLYNKQS